MKKLLSTESGRQSITYHALTLVLLLELSRVESLARMIASESCLLAAPGHNLRSVPIHPALVVLGSWECSLSLGMVAAETRGRVATRQTPGSLPWIGGDHASDAHRLQADRAVRQQETANFQLVGPEKFTGADDPPHTLQKNGGLADFWHMDDGDILCHPPLPAGIRRRQRQPERSGTR